MMPSMRLLNIYKIINTLAIPAIIVGFLFRSITQKGYRRRLPERLGLVEAAPPGGIVIHGASVGEIIALTPFIQKVKDACGDTPITVTTFTPTGSQQVVSRFGAGVKHCYLPIDAPTTVTRFLARLQPRAVVIMETELWPTLIDHCHRRGVKTLLINGRISQRSYPRYKKIKNLIGPALAQLDRLLAQSESDAEKLVSLGADPRKTCVSGNLKYDLSPTKELVAGADEISPQLRERNVWVVGSSHEDEEQIILEAFHTLRASMPELLLVIAPRHPERVGPLQARARAHGCNVVLRSKKVIPTSEHDIWLIDTMGELLVFYQLAEVCTVAGSLGKTGGHNPIEAALFAKPIVVGPRMENFRDITQQLEKAEGVLQIADASGDSLATAVRQLFLDPERARKMGANAASVLRANQGSTAKSLAALQELLLTRHSNMSG